MFVTTHLPPQKITRSSNRWLCYGEVKRNQGRRRAKEKVSVTKVLYVV